jgi:hypothetical protein
MGATLFKRCVTIRALAEGLKFLLVGVWAWFSIPLCLSHWEGPSHSKSEMAIEQVVKVEYNIEQR